MNRGHTAAEFLRVARYRDAVDRAGDRRRRPERTDRNDRGGRRGERSGDAPAANAEGGN